MLSKSYILIDETPITVANILDIVFEITTIIDENSDIGIYEYLRRSEITVCHKKYEELIGIKNLLALLIE